MVPFGPVFIQISFEWHSLRGTGLTLCVRYDVHMTHILLFFLYKRGRIVLHCYLCERRQLPCLRHSRSWVPSGFSSLSLSLDGASLSGRSQVQIPKIFEKHLQKANFIEHFFDFRLQLSYGCAYLKYCRNLHSRLCILMQLTFCLVLRECRTKSFKQVFSTITEFLSVTY